MVLGKFALHAPPTHKNYFLPNLTIICHIIISSIHHSTPIKYPEAELKFCRATYLSILFCVNYRCPSILPSFFRAFLHIRMCCCLDKIWVKACKNSREKTWKRYRNTKHIEKGNTKKLYISNLERTFNSSDNNCYNALGKSWENTREACYTFLVFSQQSPRALSPIQKLITI
jgi:hypothetical protein